VDVSKLTDKARVAADRGNYDYAIELYRRFLELQPNDIDARKALRAVEMRKLQERGITKSTASGWIKGLGSFIAALVLIALRKYEKAMVACENFLANDPYNRTVLCLLGRAAAAAGHLDAAILAYEEVRSNDGTPTGALAVRSHVSVLRRLGELYTETKQLPLASERIEEILHYIPNDRDAERLLRDIAAQRSMVEGGWDKAGKKGGYREVLKDEQKAKDLEDSHRDIRTREDVVAAIERVKKDLAEQPDNVRYLIQLADYYRMLKDWKQARATYERARKLDPMNFMIAERLGDLKLAEMDEQIKALAKDPTKRDQAAELQRQRLAFAMEEYERRVKARPQDLPTRYAFGEILFKLGRYKDAAVQFQHASRDPRSRRGALYRLGLCFEKQGLIDLAVEQFEKAVSGASLIDQEAKEILYSLAQAHERQGRLDQALETYKKIFEIDIGFKDVSQKIEQLLKQGSQSKT